MATVILENVNAHFPIYGAQQQSLRKALFQRATGGSIEREGKNNDRITVKALSDISLTLRDGDRVGLVGHNGAGKSTLLKLMAGIYPPVSGTVRIEGRVTPLFDAMPGLDGEDTGYENIITSGMLIGMTRREIEAKIPEIEEFCELGEYLSLPVRTYSTGMTMRLGFALVTSLDPGVILMDEGFGTGDLRFTERAEARMKEFIGRSPIMVLASHSDKIIRTMCNKAVLMEAGRIVAFGPADEICDQYYESVHAAAAAAERARQMERAAAVARVAAAADAADEIAGTQASESVLGVDHYGMYPRSSLNFPLEALRPGDDVARLHSAQLLVDHLDNLETIDRNELISVEMKFEVMKPGHTMMPNFHVFLGDQYVFVSSPPQTAELEPGIYTTKMSIPRGFLNVGFFVIGVALTSVNPQRIHFYIQQALRFSITERAFEGIPGPVRPSMGWDVTRA
ncbi:ABC-type polysaccharide/polyol phosphate transport system ATPase subunit [Bradyrhizobium sp. cir1]|uniref:ABC transporter ATP-binding protein n=1 Tax=Bradyrhizobium sp. cir1 TaxID=1445730 RepID=UPI0016061D81|nr:ABC transporter ATP-binding protein [Bradyrhizobium sp. cir1]MBB4368413.1 ABC-type polysaccharide/polyol phosphate transport system ATPase subunit [Bradyrhizobium sp. cir1]